MKEGFFKRRTGIPIFCFFITFFSLSISAEQEPQPLTGQHAREYRGDRADFAGQRYLLYLPDEYGKEEKKWPMIVFLHGSSVRGKNLNKIKRCGLPWLVEHRDGFPFIVISPQCPKGKRWVDIDNGCIMDIVDEICAEYSVDTDRVYVTGLSMGGHGAWYLASKYPDRFAAVAPLCGRADTSWAETVKDVPVWVFHGSRDSVCPIRYSDRMVEALRSRESDVTYTVYEGAGHDIVTRTYKNEELYTWFLSHHRNGAIHEQ